MGTSKYAVQAGLATLLLFLSFVVGAIVSIIRGKVDGVSVIFIALMIIFSIWSMIAEHYEHDRLYKEHKARLKDIWEDVHRG